MKKRIKLLWIIISSTAIALTVVLFFCFFNRERAVPLLHDDTIAFGKSEEEICSALGNPDRQFHDNVSIQKSICYERVVAENIASVEFYINKETDEMWQVTITWKAESEKQLNAIRESIVSDLQSELGASLIDEENHVLGEVWKNFRVFDYDIILIEEAERLKLRIR